MKKIFSEKAIYVVFAVFFWFSLACSNSLDAQEPTATLNASTAGSIPVFAAQVSAASGTFATPAIDTTSYESVSNNSVVESPRTTASEVVVSAPAPVPIVAPTTSAVAPVASIPNIIVGRDPGEVTLLQASQLAKDGDIVVIRSGTYTGVNASWRQNNLTIKSDGGTVEFDAAGQSAEGKGIFVIKGNNVTVDGITFKNCRVEDKNGAGIRHEGGKLTVKNSVFLDNEEGILTGNIETQSLFVFDSIFSGNGDSLGYAHGIYAGQIGEFYVEGSYLTKGKEGHLIKSRAKTSKIYYNRITDETGFASVEIDLPNGGDAFVVGNIIEQGVDSRNNSIITYGFEGITKWSSNALYVSHNTIVNNLTRACNLIVAPFGGVHTVINNVFPGSPCSATPLSTSNWLGNNVATPSAFANYANYDFRLASTSLTTSLIPSSLAAQLTPLREYKHPAKSIPITRTKLFAGAIQSAP